MTRRPSVGADSVAPNLTDTPPPERNRMYTEAQGDIDTMLAQHAPLPAIEGYLDACRELPDDEQAALWLYAWVKLQRLRRRAQGLALELGHVGKSAARVDRRGIRHGLAKSVPRKP